MSDYRDPKVTKPTQSTGGGAGKIIGIAIAIVVLLMLLAWLIGDRNIADPASPEGPAAIENSDVGGDIADPVVPQEPAATQAPIVEGDTTDPAVVE